MKRYGRPREIVTDRLPSYRAALTELGAEELQSSGRWLNNRVENSHLPLRRRERARRRRIDERFVKINGEHHYLWRAVDHEGEVLEAVVTKRHDGKAALKFHRKLMRRYGCPREIVTDRLPSYGAALKELGAGDLQSLGRWLNNRVENSHLPLRRRARAMLRFRRMRSLQTFAAVHSSVFNQ